MTSIAEIAADWITEVRTKNPLIHHITNYVTANDCANIVLAVGGSPVMADAPEEAADITALSSALVINIGTLNERTISSMIASGKRANALHIPVVLDPVGAGASVYRTQTAIRLIKEIQISVLRGNYSEIGCLYGMNTGARGVDAVCKENECTARKCAEWAAGMARRLSCVVAMTGAVDVIADEKRTVMVSNGHPMMARVSGTGCMGSSLVGTFCGAADDVFAAAVAGIICMGIAGEMAFEAAGLRGTGSFKAALTDAVSTMEPCTVVRRTKLHEV